MRRSTRRHVLALGAIAGLGLGLSSIPASAQTKWNLPAAYPATNYHTENLVQFAKDVETATGGKLQITVHANASLFKAPEIKRAVATGQAQIGEVLISIHENEDPMFGIDVVPFLAASFPESKKLWDVSKPAIEKKLASQGLMVLMGVPWGPQGLYFKQEINKIEDMKGIKFRSYNAGTTRIAELAGMQAVTIQAAELPQALATGVVTSFISSGSTGYDSKVWESLTHWYDTKAWIPKNITFVNKGIFDALPKDQQDALLKAAKEAEERGWKIAEEKATWYIGELKAKGMKVLHPSPELSAGLKKFGEDLTATWLKKAGADGQAVIDAFKK
jgi:TRAP-type C4-dicarboxylate transport system substrate-binding protein